MTTKINTAFDEAVKAGYKGTRTQFIKAFNAGEVGENGVWKKFWHLLVIIGNYLWCFGFIAACWTGTINYFFKQLSTVGEVGIVGMSSFFVSAFLTYYNLNLLNEKEKPKK